MLEYKDIIRMVAVFLMQLLICEAGFLVGLPRRKHFTVRLIGSAVLFIGVVGANLYVRRILPGEEKPMRIDVEMDADVGFFQVEEVLMQKLSMSPAQSLVELYAGVSGLDRKRYL